MATARPFAYNSGSQFSGTTQYGNVAVLNDGADYTGIPLEWYNGPDEDLGYVIAHAVGQRNIGNNAYTSTGNVVGFWRSTTKDEASFLDLFESFRKETGATVSVATGDDCKTWLEANGYWTSWGLGGASVGNYYLINAYTDAGSPGWITFPNHQNFSGELDPNLIGQTYGGTQIYINLFDSASNDNSVFLSQLIGNHVHLTLSQNGSSITFNCDPNIGTTFRTSGNEIFYDNVYEGGYVGAITILSSNVSLFNTGDPITISIQKI